MSLIITEQHGYVKVITLNREDARNALSVPLMQALKQALVDAEQDPHTRCLMITGKGDKAFCSGADLSNTMATEQQSTPNDFLQQHHNRQHIAQLFLGLRQHPKPIIAAVNGLALAGGMGLMLACDLAVAREDACLGLPEVKRGLMPYMVMALLNRHIGSKRTLELVLTGQNISAAQALNYGLINQIISKENFTKQAIAYAQTVANYSSAVLQMGKRAFYKQQDLDLEHGIDFLHQQLTINAQLDDFKEGIAAFFEKRTPDWKNS